MNEQGVLEITNVDNQDDGTYTCTGSNGYGVTVQKFYVIFLGMLTDCLVIWGVLFTHVNILSN